MNDEQRDELLTRLDERMRAVHLRLKDLPCETAMKERAELHTRLTVLENHEGRRNGIAAACGFIGAGFAYAGKWLIGR